MWWGVQQGVQKWRGQERGCEVVIFKIIDPEKADAIYLLSS